MNLKTALKAIMATKYMVVMGHKNHTYEYVRINYMGSMEDLDIARERLYELSETRNKVNFITYNHFEGMIEIQCEAI